MTFTMQGGQHLSNNIIQEIKVSVGTPMISQKSTTTSFHTSNFRNMFQRIHTTTNCASCKGIR
jgi:hypothetical protein